MLEPLKKNTNTRNAVKLPSILNELDVKPKTELKKRLTKGIVSPAPIEINIKGEIAFKYQSPIV